jgi:hypothetical protein
MAAKRSILIIPEYGNINWNNRQYSPLTECAI